ncbi:MAG: response regulator [Synergistaceae bacterium]|jgi:signal transduction histidine kinase/HPt (histidine-containing phosphotransfer) domain-containing protein/ActR/RegA family two-component response regulator|nr:response regulator [Synergistaceae bacterium]
MTFINGLKSNKKQLIFVFIAFLLMVLASYFFMSRIVERHIFSNAREMLTAAEKTVSARLREMEVTVLNAALVIESDVNSGQSIDQIQKYATNMTQGFSDPQSGIAGFLGIYGMVKGEFFNGYNWTPPEGFKPEERPWYLAAMGAEAKTENRVAFTFPYVDIRTGRYVLSASKNLKNSGGEIVGIVVLDVDVNEMADYVRSLRLTSGGYGVLLGQDLRVIAYPDKGYEGKTYGNLSASHADFARSMQDEELSSGQVQNTEGANVVTFFRRTANGWYLGIATPVQSYYRDVYLMGATLTLLGLLFMSILSYLLIRLSVDKQRSDEENRGKSTFLARISHEIRTPMNSIMGMSELLLRKDLSSDFREYISIIHQSGSSLLGIIDEILDFSKIESGVLKLNPAEYSFASVIKDVVRMSRIRLVDSPLDFFVCVDPNIPARLVGDKIYLRQILFNLLNNAVKYTPSGSVSLEVRKKILDNDSLELIFIVSDTGIGIKKEDVEKIFVDFSRLNDERRQHVEGTGLGLSIVRTYCELMGGSVTVQSDYGQGSVFTARVVQGFKSGERAAVVPHPRRLRVLVHEDQSFYERSILRALEDLGVRPHNPETWEEFLEKLEHDEWDYIFVSSRRASDCFEAMAGRDRVLPLIVMTKLEAAFAFDENNCVLLPAYSLSVADAFAGYFEKPGSESHEPQTRFAIPDAEVLIVDDSPSNLKVAKELVAHYGARVETCGSGREALELVRRNRYDLVFMDHMMPDMDGVETTAAIRELGRNDPRFLNLPIIALTANVMGDQKEMLLKKGMDAFLSKPINMQRLERLLRMWIPLEKQVEAPLNEKTPESDFPEGLDIPGVNAQWGLKNMGGDFDVYRDALNMFHREAKGMIPRIEDCLKNEDFALYAIHVHSLKGMARNVGAFSFADAAAQMEEAAIYGKTETIRGKTEDLLLRLRELTENIRSALALESGESDAEGRVSIRELHLEDLKQALLDMNIRKINEFFSLYMTLKLDPQTKEAIDEIESSVLMYEYDNAVKKIDLLRRN